MNSIRSNTPSGEGWRPGLRQHKPQKNVPNGGLKRASCLYQKERRQPSRGSRPWRLISWRCTLEPQKAGEETASSPPKNPQHPAVSVTGAEDEDGTPYERKRLSLRGWWVPEIKSQEPQKSPFCAKEQSADTNKPGANKSNPLQVINWRLEGPNQEPNSNNQPVNSLCLHREARCGGKMNIDSRFNEGKGFL